jgi:outer membrane protein insertion porin family
MCKKFYFFLIALFFFSSSFVFSEIVNDIEINGNNRITNNTILVLGDITLNKDYDENELNTLVKKLYDTGFFKDVSISLDKKILKIKLIEYPIIEDIEIIGIKRTSIKDLLLDRMTLKSRKPFNELVLSEDLNLILNNLKLSGYYFAKISSSTEINKSLNTVRLKLIIEQGEQAKIKKINFIGDKKIKDKKLYEIIASEEHRFWKIISKNVYLDQSRINLDVRLIENYYKNLGYYNVKVLSSFAEFNKLGNFNLTYNIEAGNLYYFNNLRLNLPKEYNSNDFKLIQNQFDKLKGALYSVDSFNKILSDIEKIASLRLYDFIDAKVEEEFVENNKINFEFIVSDSTSYYVENINIFGNYNTIEEVIRNKLIVDEGDPLNKILYNRSIDNLRSSGFFKNVDAKIYDGTSDKLKKIDITVEEKPTGEISLAAGVGTSGSTIGGGIKENNFLGKGIKLNTTLELSEGYY